MAELILKTTQPERAAAVVKQAIRAEIARIKYIRQQARQRLDYFEQKYHVTSEQFLDKLTAEDLEGKDLEYVEWAGEYQLFLDLDEDLNMLNSLVYVTS